MTPPPSGDDVSHSAIVEIARSKPRLTDHEIAQLRWFLERLTTDDLDRILHFVRDLAAVTRLWRWLALLATAIGGAAGAAALLNYILSIQHQLGQLHTRVPPGGGGT